MNIKLREAAIHGTKDYPFSIYDITVRRHPFYVSLHWHEELEIIYINQGPVFITINKQDYIGENGDLFVVNPAEIHGMHSAQPASYGTMLFAMSYLMFAEGDAVVKEYLQPLLQGNRKIVNEITDSRLRADIFQLIGQILSINRTKPDTYQFGTKVMLLEILYKLAQKGCFTQNEDFPGPNMRNHEILSYISEHCNEDLRLQEIAGHFNMSYKYFSRYFRNNFNTTFSDYLANLRIEYAANLLTSTDLSVTEVALQSGFNNLSFFIRYFKKIYGITPLKYRRQKTSNEKPH